MTKAPAWNLVVKVPRFNEILKSAFNPQLKIVNIRKVDEHPAQSCFLKRDLKGLAYGYLKDQDVWNYHESMVLFNSYHNPGVILNNVTWYKFRKTPIALMIKHAICWDTEIKTTWFVRSAGTLKLSCDRSSRFA